MSFFARTPKKTQGICYLLQDNLEKPKEIATACMKNQKNFRELSIVAGKPTNRIRNNRKTKKKLKKINKMSDFHQKTAKSL